MCAHGISETNQMWFVEAADFDEQLRAEASAQRKVMMETNN